jgi:hypothetical protein
MFFCETCRQEFKPKPEEQDFLEELFGFRGSECSSFCPWRKDAPADPKSAA